MLSHYLSVAFRNLFRYKLFSFLNIFGLALGMSVCLISILQVRDAFQYDTFHPHPDRLYRILTEVTKQSGDKVSYASSPMPLGPRLQNEFDIIEKSSRVYNGVSGKMHTDIKTLSVNGAFVDPAFFEIFGFGLATGQAAVAPRTAVLTFQTAKRFFGEENPVGKTVNIEKLGLFTITGVLEPAPSKSHMQFDLLASMATLPLVESLNQTSLLLNTWENYESVYTYVLLKEGIDRANFEGILTTIATQAMKSFHIKRDKGYTFSTQAFTHISPGREKLMNITQEPIVRNLLTVGAIALSVLVLAIFNYINLTLARSLSRGREVGVRKIIGAKRMQLMYQFIVESMLSMVLSLGLAYILFEQIRHMAVVERIVGEVQWDVSLWLTCIGFSLIVGILAGMIPARVLSAFQPVQALKSQLNIQAFKGIKLRKVLTVAQFSASLTAMVFILVFYRQTSYMSRASYGFNQEHILNISLQGQPYDLLAQQISSLSGVERVSATSTILGTHAKGQLLWRERNASLNGIEGVTTFTYAVDTNFLSTMGLTLLAGHNLQSSNQVSSKGNILINEEAVKIFRLGDPTQALGQLLWLNDSTEVQVAGVVKDFRYQSFLFPIAPLMLYYQPLEFNYINAKIAGGQSDFVLSALERIWKQLYPYQPFSAQWFEKQLYEQNFQLEDQLFIGMLTAMALSIACLGLLGIVMYSTQTRLKEVGIRKVIGASVAQIVLLLSKEFLRLLLLSGFIGLPLGFYVSNLFLQQYTYHITIGVGTLLVCFALLLLLGCLAIGSQTVRAALANPIQSLRNE